uniref:C2H2-type domain-containing protein n=1 Tax=Palpitomonas bilix TaxID=652834 RepID=A0A7S3DEJ1_9EUKA|mmetsp:Transcript_34280/g.88572  ORF Transcript_34280/g.88572 Transcript_34280/m.88572 type:complete len:285 (+) Transcript_34280:337-1191(+)
MEIRSLLWCAIAFTLFAYSAGHTIADIEKNEARPGVDVASPLEARKEKIILRPDDRFGCGASTCVGDSGVQVTDIRRFLQEPMVSNLKAKKAKIDLMVDVFEFKPTERDYAIMQALIEEAEEPSLRFASFQHVMEVVEKEAEKSGEEGKIAIAALYCERRRSSACKAAETAVMTAGDMLRQKGILYEYLRIYRVTDEFEAGNRKLNFGRGGTEMEVRRVPTLLLYHPYYSFHPIELEELITKKTVKEFLEDPPFKNDRNLYVCKKCGRTFVTQKMLGRHKQIAH